MDVSNVSYDPETGMLTRIKKKGTAPAGPFTLGNHPNGYGYIRNNGKRYLAHRVAWYIHTGEIPDTVDHINGNKRDNRIVNLRNVTRAQNSQNMKMSKRNTSGIQGIRRVSKNRWRANRSKEVLGHFACIGLAIKARNEATAHYHENHGRSN
jgi:hypothetical protein